MSGELSPDLPQPRAGGALLLTQHGKGDMGLAKCAPIDGVAAWVPGILGVVIRMQLSGIEGAVEVTHSRRMLSPVVRELRPEALDVCGYWLPEQTDGKNETTQINYFKAALINMQIERCGSQWGGK